MSGVLVMRKSHVLKVQQTYMYFQKMFSDSNPKATKILLLTLFIFFNHSNRGDNAVKLSS